MQLHAFLYFQHIKMILGFRKFRTRKCIVLLVISCCALLYFEYLSNATNIKFESNIMDFRRERFARYQMQEPHKTGPGENGEALLGKMPPGFDEAMENEAFNYVLSDQIALNRSLPDVRSEQCSKIAYAEPSQLPSASVIIIYYNEARSVLLRTVHSVVNRTPPECLHEIILVDDGSTRDELQTVLTDYIRNTWPDGIVRQLKISARVGLISARQSGAKVAKGDVLIFLDAHCEVTNGWAEPLLSRIQADRTAVICPQIDHIQAMSMGYGVWKYRGTIGSFKWAGTFSWTQRASVANGDGVTPYASPTMAGGLFAMERNYFFELGGYDTGMQIWGGENLEMSFRVWMCGGSVEIAPCSHVGHIFRDKHPYGFPDDKDYHGMNTKRVVEVWMDDYKEIFYYFRPDLKEADCGNITDRLQLRKRLKCHDFKWYLKNIVPEKFVYNDDNTYGYGMISNPVSNLCFDLNYQLEGMKTKLGLSTCAKFLGANQMFALTRRGQLRREYSCADYKSKLSGDIVYLSACTGSVTQAWKYHESTQTLQHTSTGFCLNSNGTYISTVYAATLTVCTMDPSQKWLFQFKH